MDLKRTVNSLVRRYGTRDPYRIADAMGIIVIRVPLKGIRGFYQCMKRCRILYIADDLSEADARFVCAHELGHAILHRGYNRIFLDAHTHFPANRYEAEANRFAVDLLFDDEDLQFFLDYPIQLAADFMGVTVELAEYRLSTFMI